MSKGKFINKEEFLPLLQCFNLYSIIALSLIESFRIDVLFSKSSASDLLYVGKGYVFAQTVYCFDRCTV